MSQPSDDLRLIKIFKESGMGDIHRIENEAVREIVLKPFSEKEKEYRRKKGNHKGGGESAGS